MKITIVGAGAMGQLFGARLAIAGNEVTFVDAAEHIIDVLNRDGITVTTDGRPEWTPARAGTATDFSGTVDLIVVFTKGFHTAAALESVRHLVGSHTVGLTLQNGLGNAEVLARYLGAAHTLMGTTDYPADLRRPGHVHTSADGKIRVGAFAAASDSNSAGVAAILNTAHLNAIDEPRVEVAIWEKVAFNAALNTLSAVTGGTVGEIAAESDYREIVASVIDETVAVATALGIDLDRHRIDAAIANAYSHHADHKTSMLQDRDAGRRTEADFIGGAVVRRGRQAGVATPVLWTLNTLAARPVPRTHTAPPTPTSTDAPADASDLISAGGHGSPTQRTGKNS